MRNYTWLVAPLIGLLSLAYISAETEEQIREVTVRSLKFLTTYQANVAAHHAGSVDDELKKEFLEKWKGSFFTREEILKIYNSIEKDWRYALDLASSSEDNLSALVVALHTKMEAYMQSLYYMPPRFLLKYYPERYDSEHCHHIAAKLLILSYIGTDQLIEKFLSIAGPSLSSNNFSDIKEYQILIPMFCNYARCYLRDKLPPIPDEYKMSDATFDEFVNVLENDPLLEAIKRLFAKMMFVHFPVTIEKSGYVPYWNDEEYWHFLWEKAKDINKRLTEGEDNYSVTSALHDILTQRTDFGKLSKEDFVNELKEINLVDLEIGIVEGVFSINPKKRLRTDS